MVRGKRKGNSHFNAVPGLPECHRWRRSVVHLNPLAITFYFLPVIPCSPRIINLKVQIARIEVVTNYQQELVSITIAEQPIRVLNLYVL